MPHASHARRGSRPLRLRRALITGTALAACLVIAPALPRPDSARADGDPASDVLLTENVFYSFSTPVSRPLQADLDATVARAHAAGFPVKVALIESTLDLGAIPQLFGRPEQYAKFLDYEISYNSVARLLVVMPHGFGTFAAGPVSALATIHINPAMRTNGLARAAIFAIQRLAAIAGHKIAIPKLGADQRTSPSSALPFLLLVPLTALVLVMAVLWRKRRGASPFD
jgi:hypothetical protein